MFRRKTAPVVQPVWMFVGLGNPGPAYHHTRHNVGFDVVEGLAAKHKIKIDHSKFRARYGLGQIDGVPVVLVRPLTFMNLSGEAVAPLAKSFGLDPQHCVVISDDLDLVIGRVRFKPKGSAGGHNGHKSLIRFLGTTEYPRIKIGIGSVDRDETIDHVLGTFKPDEKPLIENAIAHSIDACEYVCRDGLDKAISWANLPEE